MTWFIIVVVLICVIWALFCWMVCSISAISDEANYRLLLFQEGLDNGSRTDGEG